MKKPISPQQRNRIAVQNFHCEAHEHLYINPEGRLIERYESGYTLIRGVYMEGCKVLFSGIVKSN